MREKFKQLASLLWMFYQELSGSSLTGDFPGEVELLFSSPTHNGAG